VRILHLLASPAFSGPAENVALLAAAQTALGHQVSVAVDRKRAQVSSEEPAVPRLEALQLLDDGGLELSVKSGPRALWSDLRALHNRPVDVVHAHFTHDHLLARWGRPRGAKLIRSIHAARSLRWSLPRADAFTVPSERELPRVRGSRALVLPPLVDPAFIQPVDRRRLQRELGVEAEPLIGMVSTFQPSRRHALGIEAFARLRPLRAGARLALVGDGALLPELQDRVKARGLTEWVHFAGYQSGPAFVRWLQALDELWILGLGNDHSGRAAAQARACGVRVVAVDEGALAEAADGLIAGLDPDAVVRASLEDTRQDRTRPDNLEVARRVLELYG
jgi:glycosyltransferase involved in cell wall biosynthesis